MKAVYVSTLQHRVVLRANGAYRVQELRPELMRKTDPPTARNDLDPWVNISPRLSKAEALALLRGYEPDKKAHGGFYDKHGRVSHA